MTSSTLPGERELEYKHSSGCFGFDGTDEWKGRRDTLFAALHANPKAKFVTRLLQFGSEPLFDWVLDPPVLIQQVKAAKANLSSLQIPVTVSDMAYSFRDLHANDGGPDVLKAIDMFDAHILPFFSTQASTANKSWPIVLSDLNYFIAQGDGVKKIWFSERILSIRGPTETTLTNAERMTKKRAQEAWTRDWKKNPAHRRFRHGGAAWNPKPHVKHTAREVFARATQCRTNHAFIGEYYSKFVPSEPIGCPCGGWLQTREHIIKDCPRYEEKRQLFRDVDEEIELKTRLGTNKGLKALAKFIEKTGAFTKSGNPREGAKKPTLNDDAREGEDNDESWWENLERSGIEDE
ncbi:hypothetical protein H0H87_011218 [Tephrocybe sp. NHM501043]|nr:hypothetical protein H0H87_011218 [Tephrocybe sp. NHM501043]